MTQEQLSRNKKNELKKIKLNKKLENLYKETSEEVINELLILLQKYKGNKKEVVFSDLKKYNRLQEIRKFLDLKLSSTYGNINNLLITDLFDLFKANFLSEMYLLEKGTMYSFFNNTMLNDDTISIAVNHKINKLTLSDRLHRNKTKIISNTISTLSKDLLMGKSVDKISKDLSTLYYQDKNKTLRIARTEIHNITEEATYQADIKARDLGIEFKRKWIATLNKRTRDTHRKLDGQFENEKGYFTSKGHKAKRPGNFGVAKEDINCRCTTIATFDYLPNEKRYSQDDDKYIDYKTFDEWKKSKNL